MNCPPSPNEYTRFRALRLLEDNPDLIQHDIADELGDGLGSVNDCLRALADKGMIKNFRNSNYKMGYLYLLTPKGIADKTALPAQFLNRKMVEYEARKSEIESLNQEPFGPHHALDKNTK